MRVLACLMIVALGGVAQAGFELQITGGSYTAAQAGTVVTEDIFLVGTGGDVVNTISAARFDVTSGGPTAVTSYAVNPLYNSGFNDLSFPVINQSVSGGGSAPGADRLGTISFTLGGVGSVTPISLTNILPGGILAAVNGGGTGSIDAQFSATSQNFTVAVPEPTSLALVGTFGLVGLFRRNRRS